MQRPLILATNDDGIRAKGLRAMVNIAKAVGRVLVVAPEKVHSGQSHAITSTMPLRLRKVEENYFGEDVEAYACDGTPVDCVKLAMAHLLSGRPDMILSGINHGSNSSISVVYSGTMAAAQEGSLYGIPSIGISLLDWIDNPDFAPSISIGKKIVLQVMQNGLRHEVCLNVNIPAIPLSEIKGVKICRQANGTWIEDYDRRVDPHGGEYFWLRGKFVNNEPEAQDTDEWALSNGYASIVPIQPDMTSYAEIDRLKLEWKI
ncbi:MAG: 5'/3'-nucleotidase SurE [Prevotellaceae bacterium]|jgi:5'-nucleotidase|nr:5'/3'-nucleotidase SurE [Prevotellaceae bacterium]